MLPLCLSPDLKAFKVISHFLVFGESPMAKKKKKTKRKLAHPKLPMQRHLNLRHEGTHFDLRAVFDELNERYFRGRLRGYKVVWGRRRKHRPREHFIFGTIHEDDRSEEHTSELQSLRHLVCRLLLEKKKKQIKSYKIV